MPLTGRSLQVALDDPADGCCAEASAWALHEGVRLPPWSAVSWQVDWRDATSPADARPFRGRRWWLLGNGGESREAPFLFYFSWCMSSRRRFNFQNKFSVTSRSRQSEDSGESCPVGVAMRPSCYVGAVLNLRPARRIVGRMGGGDEEKKKRGGWGRTIRWLTPGLGM